MTYFSSLRLYIAGAVLLSLCMVQCKSQSSSANISLPSDQEDVSYEEEYSVILKDSRLSVSSHLMGFNLVYPQERDAIWQDGKIEGYLKDLSTSLLRWPGGTVSSYYHWDELTGEGWEDSWNPQNPGTPKPASEFMNVDEYMELIRSTGATPLLGINMSSGWRWDRLEDGINEALDLMRYCKDNDFEVKYWYLDNEPYMEDSNGGVKMIEEYAKLINLFASRMREVNPDIKIVVNWKAAFSTRSSVYRTLLDIAGDNIDIIDVHQYWSWNDPTMEKWLSHTPMKMWTGDTYLEEIAYFRDMVSDFGYPDIQLGFLEWNVGPIDNDQLNSHQTALIQSEMLMQFMLGGLDMATFWPIHWPSKRIISRSLVNPETNEHQPNYFIFKFLSQLQGGMVIEEEVTKPLPHVLNLIMEDEDEGIVKITFLNKNDVSVRVNIRSERFGDMVLQEAKAFTLLNGGNSSEINTIELLNHSDGETSFVAQDISVSMLTFKEK